MRSFASDNNSGISDSILEAIREANSGHQLAYGDDPYSKSFLKMLRKILERPCDLFCSSHR